MIDLVSLIFAASPDPIPVVIPSGDSTSANQITLIIVAIISATASILTAGITAFFAYLMVRVKRVTEATHSIVNHDRQVMLEGQARTLRAASLEHPEDEVLKIAWERAEVAAMNARMANELPGSKLGE
jgi:hypothetical protein